MDGLLVVDKPAGPTSHDVVARVRRVLHERRVGHTGTLDPIATGVLPLVVGRATRLARFLSAGDKTYEAQVALGCATDTGDALGTPIPGPESSSRPAPSRDEIERALDAFRGTFLQQPPVYSAKKLAGKRSYELARSSVPAGSLRPQPVPVTVHRLDLVDIQGSTVTLTVDCAAGFYVRALAHELGERLGLGGHLVALRRIRSGEYTVNDAVPLDEAERDAASATGRLIPLSRMLPQLPSIELTPEGVRRARHGQNLGPGDAEKGVGGRFPDVALKTTPDPFFRLTDPTGDLVGIARPADAPGLLHPFVILG